MVVFFTKHDDELCLAVAQDLNPGSPMQFITLKELLKKLIEII